MLLRLLDLDDLIESQDAHITHIGAAALAHALKNNKTLKSLFLGANHIGDEGAHDLNIALQENSGLQFLDLTKTGISDGITSALVETYRSHPTLTAIALHGNRPLRKTFDLPELKPLKSLDEALSMVDGTIPGTLHSSVSEQCADGIAEDEELKKPHAADEIVPLEAPKIRERRIGHLMRTNQDSCLPIRSQIYSHKDSLVNYMHLRVRDEDGAMKSLVAKEAGYDEWRADRKAFGQTEVNRRKKNAAMDTSKFNPKRFGVDMPPMDYVFNMQHQLMHKYPKGIDKAKNFPSLATVYSQDGSEDWGDPTTAIVFKLAQQKH